jgi:hypothetical protein
VRSIAAATAAAAAAAGALVWRASIDAARVVATERFGRRH